MRAAVAISLAALLAGCTASSTTGQGAATSAAPVQCALPFTNFAETGFIHIPGGAFAPDPAAQLEPDPARPDAFSRTVAKPALYAPAGSASESYDWPRSRWVPVARALVSPDGAAYVYTELIPNPASQGLGGPPPLGTRVHLVDVGSGTDSVIYQTSAVLAAAWFGPAAIYLTEKVDDADTVTAFRVWQLDPSSRVATLALGGASAGPGPFAIDGSALWIMAADPSDPKAPGTMLRVALSGGASTVWYRPSGGFAEFLGLDPQAHPVISTSTGADGDTGRTIVVSAPGSASALTDQGFIEMLTDRHGMWLNGNGVWLASGSRPVEKMAPEIGGALLGACG